MFKQVSVMNGQQFGNIPASRFEGNPAEAVYPQHDIKGQIEALSQKIERVIEVNVMLQQKITKLGEAIAELAGEIRQNKDEMQMPEPMEGVPTPHGIPPAPIFEFDEEKETAEAPRQASDAVHQMRLLTEQNVELITAIRDIKEKIGKESSRDKLTKALHRAGAV
jgi:hypothetical protein